MMIDEIATANTAQNRAIEDSFGSRTLARRLKVSLSTIRNRQREDRKAREEKGDNLSNNDLWFPYALKNGAGTARWLFWDDDVVHYKKRLQRQFEAGE